MADSAVDNTTGGCSSFMGLMGCLPRLQGRVTVITRIVWSRNRSVCCSGMTLVAGWRSVMADGTVLTGRRPVVVVDGCARLDCCVADSTGVVGGYFSVTR